MLTSRQVGHDILGPIFYEFCYRLWLHQLAYHNRNAVALFMARGGLRLRYFYQLFLKKNNLSPPCPHKDFYVSRLSTWKAGLLNDIHVLSDEIANEYNWEYSTDAFSMFLPSSTYKAWLNSIPAYEVKRLASTRISGQEIRHLLSEDHPGFPILSEYLHEQRTFLREHLHDLCQSARTVLLVDTGWSGSILLGLRLAAPELNFLAHFFGRYNYGKPDKPWFTDVVGISVQARKYSPLKPITSIFMHRHLIEGLCEIQWRSVEGYVRDPHSSRVIPDVGVVDEKAIIPDDNDDFALGIAEYIRTCPHGLNTFDLHSQAYKAARRLRRLICYPNPKETRVMTVPPRSVDFGKELFVPVLYDPAKFSQPLRKLKHIEESLWPLGQIALEFPFGHRISQFSLLYLTTYTPLKRIIASVKRQLRKHTGG